MEVVLHVTVSDKELLDTLKTYYPEAAHQVKRDFFTRPAVVDFSRIQDRRTREFHLSGFAALVINLLDEMEAAAQSSTPNNLTHGTP